MKHWEPGVLQGSVLQAEYLFARQNGMEPKEALQAAKAVMHELLPSRVVCEVCKVEFTLLFEDEREKIPTHYAIDKKGKHTPCPGSWK